MPTPSKARLITDFLPPISQVPALKEAIKQGKYKFASNDFDCDFAGDHAMSSTLGDNERSGLAVGTTPQDNTPVKLALACH